MTESRSDDRSQARREACELLGVDLDRLSVADALRVDMISALRLVIDHEQATVLDGGSADLGKLNVAVASLIALLPNRELPKPAVERDPNDPSDPREQLWQAYMTARRNGGISDQGALVDEIAVLKAENERLRAAAVPAAPSPPVALPPNVAVLPRPAPKNAPAATAPAADMDAVDLRQGYSSDNSDQSWRDFVGGGSAVDRWSNRNGL
jgi:hypothetical protein